MAQIVLWNEEALRVTAAGAWLHGQEPLHPRVQRLFARHLSWDPKGGYSICIGPDRQPLRVDDTPLHVLACHVVTQAGGNFMAAELTLSTGERAPCDIGRLFQTPSHVLYTQVVQRGLWLPCRFVPQAYYSLALHLAPWAQGGFALAGQPLHVTPQPPMPQAV